MTIDRPLVGARHLVERAGHQIAEIAVRDSVKCAARTGVTPATMLASVQTAAVSPYHVRSVSTA